MTKDEELKLAKEIDYAMRLKYGLDIPPEVTLDVVTTMITKATQHLPELGTVVGSVQAKVDLANITVDGAGKPIGLLDIAFVTNDDESSDNNGMYLYNGTEWIQITIASGNSGGDEDEEVTDEELEE